MRLNFMCKNFVIRCMLKCLKHEDRCVCVCGFVCMHAWRPQKSTDSQLMSKLVYLQSNNWEYTQHTDTHTHTHTHRAHILQMQADTEGLQTEQLYNHSCNQIFCLCHTVCYVRTFTRKHTWMCTHTHTHTHTHTKYKEGSCALPRW